MLILIKIGLKLRYFCKKILSAEGLRPYIPKIPLQPLRISCYEPDAEHPLPLALSDVEPGFQKLLQRNGNKISVFFVFL